MVWLVWVCRGPASLLELQGSVGVDGDTPASHAGLAS